MDYIPVLNMEREIVEKYRKVIPQKLLELWENNGLGMFMDGYLKTINPDEYKGILNESYFNAANSIPIMATAFGDIITWEENKYVGLVRYKYGTSEIMISNYDLFLVLLNDNSFVNKFFQIDLYDKAVEKHGTLNYDECFGYVPIFALGGKATIEQVKKVKIREHIALITELIGEI
ncbi:MAG: T6SS immunity protein Tdi1 domain-containing protein [Ruminococcus sp.]